jgi:hypothetical protein
MEVMIALLLIGGVVFAVSRFNGQQQRLLIDSTASGQVRHMRSGEYPSSCSWCKNTALARKLIMFERTAEGWRASDLAERLRSCADDEVASLASGLTSDQPRWRRICTERCAKEFFAAEHVPLKDVFVTCEYCSTRAPAALINCPNCGAVHRRA